MNIGNWPWWNWLQKLPVIFWNCRSRLGTKVMVVNYWHGEGGGGKGNDEIIKRFWVEKKGCGGNGIGAVTDKIGESLLNTGDSLQENTGNKKKK